MFTFINQIAQRCYDNPTLNLEDNIIRIEHVDPCYPLIEIRNLFNRSSEILSWKGQANGG